MLADEGVDVIEEDLQYLFELLTSPFGRGDVDV
jgi:hypothetical protein